MTPPKPHLWLVGAGPGDPDLMTLKGAKVLAQAQLVLYDSLVHRDILDLTQTIVQFSQLGEIEVGGTKGKRLALPHSRTMIHQPAMGGFQGQAADVKVEAEQILAVRKRCVDYYASCCGQPRERVLIDLDRDNFMDANEALAYGLVDQVLQKPTAKGELRTSSASI